MNLEKSVKTYHPTRLSVLAAAYVILFALIVVAVHRSVDDIGAQGLTRVDDLSASGYIHGSGSAVLGDSSHDTSVGRDLAVGRNETVTGTLNSTGALSEGGNRVFSATGTGLTSTTSTVSLNITPTTCAAGSAEIATAADGTATCAAFAPAGNIAGTTNQVAKFSSSTAVSSANIDDDGTTLSIPHGGSKFQITEATGSTVINRPAVTVNGDPAALWVNGTVGIGDAGAATPGTYLDVRHNWQSGWDDFELVNAGPNTANGVEIDYVRSYGTLLTHTSTSTGTEISHVALWGYSTGDAIKQGARERWTVDRANSANAVQMAFDLWFANSAGAIEDVFKFDASHHFSVMDSTAPALTSCGTSPTITGSDVSGTFVIGSTATGCILTFHHTWNETSGTPPIHCTVTSRAGILFQYVPTQTAITVTAIGPLSSTTFDYTCIGG